jgi:putative tricarboxylic transport membrane protein
MFPKQNRRKTDMGKKTICLILVVLVAASLALFAGRAEAQQEYPARVVQLVVAGNAGGGLDLQGRMVDQAMTVEKLTDKPFILSNKAGGGGNACTAFMVTQKGNGYWLAINSNRVILNPLMGTIEYTTKDMTPIASLTTEFSVWAVRADSKYKSAMDVLADLKKDPTSVVIGMGNVPSNDLFNILLPAKSQGIDYRKIKRVSFSSGGDLMAQLLGGHVPIIVSGASEVVAQVDAGKVRVLSVSAGSKIDRLPGAPTWRDLGMDLVLPHWRGIFGPPDMPKIAYDYWIKKLGVMVKTKTWKDLMNKYELYDAFLPGDAFMKKLANDEKTYTELLGNMGMLNSEKKQP